MNLNVPRASTVDLNICFFKQVNDDFFCVHRNIVPARNMLALMQKRPRVRSLLEYYFFFLSLFFFGFFTSFLLFIPFAIYKRDVDLDNSAFYHALTTHPAVRRDVCGDHSPISSNYA